MSYRALVTKAGLDAHERGVHVICGGLRDAGFEVIYMGLRCKPEVIARTAVDEDVDVIGVSSLAGGHRRFANKLREALDHEDIDPVLVFGGVIPEEDDEYLHEHGVQAVFRSGTLMADIVRTIEALCSNRIAKR